MATRTGLAARPSRRRFAPPQDEADGRSSNRSPACARRRNAKRPLGIPAGAIPTVDFLLYHRAPFVKKTLVKSHVAAHSSHSFTLLFTSFGSVRPSLSSADRLTEKVNSVGTSTGNSPGFAPRRIESMYLAAAISPCR